MVSHNEQTHLKCDCHERPVVQNLALSYNNQTFKVGLPIPSYNIELSDKSGALLEPYIAITCR
jgi:hypothetical protein